MSNAEKFTLADKMAALVAQNKEKFSSEEHLKSKHTAVKRVIEECAKIGISSASLDKLMNSCRIYNGSSLEIAELLQKDGFKFLDEKTFSEHKELSKANLNRALVSW